MKIDIRGEPPTLQDLSAEKNGHRRNVIIAGLVLVGLLVLGVFTYGLVRGLVFVTAAVIGVYWLTLAESYGQQLRILTGDECANLQAWRAKSAVTNAYISAVNAQKRELAYVEYLYLEEGYKQEQDALNKLALYSS